jgi:hypothetical protein
MRQVLGILILLGAFFLVKELFLKYKTIEKQDAASEPSGKKEPARPPATATALPGLPESMEAALQAAEKRGAEGLRNFLRTYGPYVRDPRLASIELDYVVLVSRVDPAEARRVFKSVQERTPTFSPIYERVKRLEKNYP